MFRVPWTAFRLTERAPRSAAALDGEAEKCAPNDEARPNQRSWCRRFGQYGPGERKPEKRFRSHQEADARGTGSPHRRVLHVEGRNRAKERQEHHGDPSADICRDKQSGRSGLPQNHRHRQTRDGGGLYCRQRR